MQFILRRLAFYLVAFWVAITLNFFIPRAMPGDAVDAVLAKFPSCCRRPGRRWRRRWGPATRGPCGAST